MARTDWSFFHKNAGVGYFNETVPGYLDWEVGSGGSYRHVGYMYNGADIGEYPSQIIKMSAAIRIQDYSYFGCLGLFICPNFQSGTPVNSTLDHFGIGTQYKTNTGAGNTILVRPYRSQDGGVAGTLNGASSRYLPQVPDGSGWIQYEVSFIMDRRYYDVDPDRPTSRAPVLSMYMRYNNGSGISTPGSAGWTDWYWMWDGGNYVSMVTPFVDGFYPWFGGIGNSSGGPYGHGQIDRVTVEYGVLP